MAKKTFEQMYSVIHTEVQKRRKKWVLSSISYMDFDDVAQILMIHINKKWDLWNQNLPLENWLSGLIRNHIFNLIRDHYGIYAPPCNNCKFNMSGDGCSLNESGLKSNECIAYGEWNSKKRDAYNLKLAVNIDSPNIRISQDHYDPDFDLDAEESRIHVWIKERLPARDFYIYQSLIVDKISINKFCSSNKKFMSEAKMCKEDLEPKIEEFKILVKEYIKHNV